MHHSKLGGEDIPLLCLLADGYSIVGKQLKCVVTWKINQYVKIKHKAKLILKLSYDKVCYRGYKSDVA